ncbi:F-box-like domain-containing protein [Kistimonas asteriae]|uniref:F-box-like domain-containing protein n=1 Tax=Kistimonas asteriae TaxID=517724 RepID=UPI001BA482DE|nr:F-box-like domain-containing protein [Kistimonas asteriae]
MAEAASPITTVFIQESHQNEQEHHKPSRWKSIKTALASPINTFKKKHTQHERQLLYERNILHSPLVRLPNLVLEKILTYLDAKAIYQLRLTCHFFEEIIIDCAKKLPCTHLKVFQFYGETHHEQCGYQTKQFLDYFDGIAWMPALSRQNSIRPQIRANASKCPLLTATLARILSNTGHLNKQRVYILPTISDTTAMLMLPGTSKRLISAHYNGTLKLWHLTENIAHCVKTLRHNNGGDVIHFIIYTTDHCLITCSFQAICFWDLDQPEGHEWLANFSEHTILQGVDQENNEISTIQLISDKEVRFASGYRNGLIIIWGLIHRHARQFYRLHEIPFGSKSICSISSLGDNFFSTMTCANHKLVHIWKISDSEGVQHVSNLRFLHDIKTLQRLGPNKLIATMGQKEHFAILKRDFLAQAPLQISWFNALPSHVEYEIFYSNSTLAELLDGRFASIGEEHVHIWDPSAPDENTRPVRSFSFPPSMDIENPEQNRRFALFPLSGPLLGVSVTSCIEIWNLTPSGLEAHGEHQI